MDDLLISNCEFELMGQNEGKDKGFSFADGLFLWANNGKQLDNKFNEKWLKMHLEFILDNGFGKV